MKRGGYTWRGCLGKLGSVQMGYPLVSSLSLSQSLSPRRTTLKDMSLRRQESDHFTFVNPFLFFLTIVSNLCISTFHVRRTTASSTLNFDEYLSTSSNPLGSLLSDPPPSSPGLAQSGSYLETGRNDFVFVPSYSSGVLVPLNPSGKNQKSVLGIFLVLFSSHGT